MKTAVAAIFATCAALGARAEEVHLKTLASHWDDNGTNKFVLGTGDYSDSKWSWTKERVFDGAWVTVSTVSGTEYTDTSIAKPTKGTYTYRIASVDGDGSLAYTLGVVPTGTPSGRGFAVIVR